MKDIAEGILAVLITVATLVFTALVMIGVFLVLTAPFWFIPLIIVAIGKAL